MTSRRPLRPLLLAVLSAVALVGAGCGTEDVVTEADTEGIWVDVGALDYHIQGSRVLEPGLVPDKSYLAGLPSNVTEPKGDELWFAVFLRVENKSGSPAQAAGEFEIVDTTGRSFTPYELDTKANPFAYAPATIPDKGAIPVPDSAQEFNSFNGAQLLFKLPLESYQNRPLEFVIKGNAGDDPDEAKLALDV
jgi:hypothetical protein